MTRMFTEFHDFINRGNVVDLAVAVVMGAAFTPVVAAVVDRVMMPIIGMVFGQPNFDTVGTFACQPAGEGIDGIAVGGEVCAGSIGAVVTVTVNFLLVALAVFLVVKAYNRTTGPDDVDEPSARSEEATLLAEIRDHLVAEG